MTYQQPRVVQSGSSVTVIHGELGKWFHLYFDFRPLWPAAMTPMAYEADE